MGRSWRPRKPLQTLFLFLFTTALDCALMENPNTEQEALSTRFTHSFPDIDIQPQLEQLAKILHNTQGSLLAPYHFKEKLVFLIDHIQPSAEVPPAQEETPPHPGSYTGLDPDFTKSLAPPSSLAPNPFPSYAPVTCEYNILVTKQITLSKLYRYPPGALIEYPETDLTGETYVSHLFHYSDGTSSPMKDILYSQGGPNGSHKDVTCLLLTDDLGLKIKCKKVNSTCTLLFSSVIYLPPLIWNLL